MNLVNSNIYLNEIQRVNIDAFRKKTIMITGASGMIGSCLVDILMQHNQGKTPFCTVIAVGRNIVAAKNRFQSYWNNPGFCFLEQDISKPIDKFSDNADYIIHAASSADPVSFANAPIDVLLSNVLGTDNLLRYGLSHGMCRFLFVSSGEMYGQPNDQMDDFVESYCGPVDHATSRACYPAGKRAAEVLCQSYVKQHGADIVIVRPCHVFGPTMTRKDSRAVTEFLWNAVDQKDIIMKSAGLIERSHCYVVDAAAAILKVLELGKCSEAYNIADRKYQMTIREFAQATANAGGCKVVFENPSDVELSGYSKISRSVLSAQKLEELGWCGCTEESSAILQTVKILREVEEG